MHRLGARSATQIGEILRCLANVIDRRSERTPI
jgi:hypothetical protein